ncbi:MAG: methyl-accepting chemotaxis protein [Tissierellales bacterium]|nr:methyl-accepting chemotaxis protein [Tissierellales bacterium]
MRKGIKIKLMCSIGFICLLSVLVCSIFSYRLSQDNLLKLSDEKIDQIVQTYGREISCWFENKSIILDNLSYDISSKQEIDSERLEKYLAGYEAKYGSIFYAGIEDNQLVSSDGWIPGEDYDYHDQDWHELAHQKGKLIFTAPYVDQGTGDMVVTIAAPIHAGGDITGTVGMDLKLDKVVAMVESNKIGKNGYGFLIDNQNRILVHKHTEFNPTKEKFNLITNIKDGQLKKIAELKNENGLRIEDYDGKEKYFKSYGIENTGWKFIAVMPISEIEEPLNNLIRGFVIIAFVILIIGFAITYVVTISMTKPINKILKIIQNTSNLNLKEIIDCKEIENKKDEFGDMGRNALTLREELRSIIGVIKDHASEIENTSREIALSSDESYNTMNTISQTSEELAKGATEQASEMEFVNKTLIDLAMKIKDAIDIADRLKVQSKKTYDANMESVVHLEVLFDKLEENHNAIKDANNRVEELAQKSETIGNVVTTIQGIAEQTNLLALNAAIEAARAGESGKGFAVVAEEIRKLAEETAKSTVEISSLIETIQQDVENATSSMKKSNNTAKEIDTRLNETQRDTKITSNSLELTKQGIEKLVEDMLKIEEEKNQAMMKMDAMVAIIEEASAGTEEVAASVEEQNLVLEKIKYRTRELNDLSKDFNEIVDKFKL